MLKGKGYLVNIGFFICIIGFAIWSVYGDLFSMTSTADIVGITMCIVGFILMMISNVLKIKKWLGLKNKLDN
ncbi:hypothetical protein [Gracilibacillus alcaliphilus]|uniref:hypothetical protein n=1 Tax=Gracilibacillus alcaliphilus TaxID=1401441 RepID=UPI001957BD54|nr:hypothetical protein [Gracilibacillus alcaliphilus]MBM7675763.1 uncharacterized protein with PQ loop repeat [Gracilibacillus alcaliphilus]